MSQNGPEPEPAATPKEMLILRANLAGIFRDVATSVSQNEFLNILTILKGRSAKSKRLYGVLFEQLQESMTDDFDEFVADCELSDKLCIVRRLTEEATLSAGEEAWRPPGNVKHHLLSLDAEKILQHSQELEEFVNAMEAENQILINQVTAGRAGARKVNERMQKLLRQETSAISNYKRISNELEKNITKIAEWS